LRIGSNRIKPSNNSLPAFVRSDFNAQKKCRAKGLSGDTRPEKLHAHEWEHPRLRNVRLHTDRPACADPRCRAVLRNVLPALFAAGRTSEMPVTPPSDSRPAARLESSRYLGPILDEPKASLEILAASIWWTRRLHFLL
jgi:hypothetical protein